MLTFRSLSYARVSLPSWSREESQESRLHWPMVSDCKSYPSARQTLALGALAAVAAEAEVSRSKVQEMANYVEGDDAVVDANVVVGVVDATVVGTERDGARVDNAEGALDEQVDLVSTPGAHPHSTGANAGVVVEDVVAAAHDAVQQFANAEAVHKLGDTQHDDDHDRVRGD